MKLIIRFFSFALVLGLGGLFVLKKPDGTPWLTMDDFVPSVDSIQRSASNVIPDQLPGGTTDVQVYRWKDSEGNWQYSDKPPVDNQAESIMVSTDVNRDLVPELKKVASTSSSQSKTGKALMIKDSSLSPTTISPDQISQVIKDAKNIQNLSDERAKMLDAIK